MSELEFGGRVAIVTGAGRGMGRSHALLLAERGARVVVNDIKAAGEDIKAAGEDIKAAGEDIKAAGDSTGAADEVVELIRSRGGQAVADYHSVSEDGAAIVQTAIDSFGQLDIVVNNAGIVIGEPYVDTPAEEWWRVFNVHFKGTIDVIRAAWPHLIESGSGRIVNIISSAMFGSPAISAYGSGKAAIWGFSNTLALEAEPVGITVNTVSPSAWTRMTSAIEDPTVIATLQKYFAPEHVSAFIAWLVHQDTTVTNQTFQVSAGRAERLTMAALPSVRVDESTPESWAIASEALLSDTSSLTAIGTTMESFEAELIGAEPEIADAIRSGPGVTTFDDAKTNV